MFTYGMPLPKMKFEIPQRSMDVFARMRNPNTSREFKEYANSLLKLVGARAVRNAGDYIMSGRAQKPTFVTLQLRQAGGLASKKALYATGEMLKSLFADVNSGTLEFGVMGPRAPVARIQEQGFAIRVSTPMIKGFIGIGIEQGLPDIIKWIRTKKAAGEDIGLGGEGAAGNTVIKVPPRPFLAPSLKSAVDHVLQSPQLQGLDAALVDVIEARLLGRVVEFDALTKYGTAYKLSPR